MAKLPTLDEVKVKIMDEIRANGHQSGPDTIAFQVVMMQTKVGVSAEIYGEAVQSLIDDGLLSHKSGSKFVMITKKGFDEL